MCHPVGNETDIPIDQNFLATLSPANVWPVRMWGLLPFIAVPSRLIPACPYPFGLFLWQFGQGIKCLWNDHWWSTSQEGGGSQSLLSYVLLEYARVVCVSFPCGVGACWPIAVNTTSSRCRPGICSSIPSPRSMPRLKDSLTLFAVQHCVVAPWTLGASAKIPCAARTKWNACGVRPLTILVCQCVFYPLFLWW